jgi:hypothetical protein
LTTASTDRMSAESRQHRPPAGRPPVDGQRAHDVPSRLRRYGRSSMMARCLPPWSRSCMSADLVERGTTAFGLTSPP